MIRLKLTYRPPMSWGPLVDQLGRWALPGIERARGRGYGRTVRIGDRVGVVLAEYVEGGDGEGWAGGSVAPHLNVLVSMTLLPVLMPVIARLRRLFDLDAEPGVIDGCLEGAGFAEEVRRFPGLRVPGPFEPFEAGLVAILHGSPNPTAAVRARSARALRSGADPLESGPPGLEFLFPDPPRVVDAGTRPLVDAGVPEARAEAAIAFARLILDGTLRLGPETDPGEARSLLTEAGGIGPGLAELVVMRALHWPDAFAPSDPVLRKMAEVPDRAALHAIAEQWRPWRAYAAHHLWRAHLAGEAWPGSPRGGAR